MRHRIHWEVVAVEPMREEMRVDYSDFHLDTVAIPPDIANLPRFVLAGENPGPWSLPLLFDTPWNTQRDC